MCNRDRLRQPDIERMNGGAVRDGLTICDNTPNPNGYDHDRSIYRGSLDMTHRYEITRKCDCCDYLKIVNCRQRSS